jgi:predicted DNA-binding transcriptional regulator AlpA
MARDRFISVNEAARLKGCSRQTIHSAISKGKLLYTTERAVVYKVSANSLAKLEINENMKRVGRPRKDRG